MNCRSNRIQIFAVQGCVLVRNRKLNQQGAELSFGCQRFEPFACQRLVFIIGLDGGRRSRLHHCEWRVG